MLRHTVENRLLVSKDDGGPAGDSRAAWQIADHMLGHLGAGTYQAHIPPKHIQQLGQLIELPAAQQGTNQSEFLVANRADRMMRLIR
jgi:hypothetical protein